MIADQRDRKHNSKPVYTGIQGTLYKLLIYTWLTFLNKKGTHYFVLNIKISSINCRVGTGNPDLPSQLMLYFTVIVDNWIVKFNW